MSPRSSATLLELFNSAKFAITEDLLSKRLLFFCCVLALGMPVFAHPLVFVGSFQVDQGPH
jgi:hypothetical protein